MTDKVHAEARATVSLLLHPDKKQLRLNDIVEAAIAFYVDPVAGARELVLACDRTSPLYVPKQPMHRSLQQGYSWMVE